jgi:hypothetical protein
MNMKIGLIKFTEPSMPCPRCKHDGWGHRNYKEFEGTLCKGNGGIGIYQDKYGFLSSIEHRVQCDCLLSLDEIQKHYILLHAVIDDGDYGV